MKIAVYFTSMSPAGGIERVIAKHIEFMEPYHELVLITDDNLPSFYPLPKSVKHESLDIENKLNMDSRLSRIFQISSFFFKGVYRLNKVISKNNPDLIYVASPLNVLKVSLAQYKCKNILVTEHASFSAYNFIYKFIARKLYKRIGLLAVPTKSDSDFYTKAGISNEYLPNPLPFFPNTPSSLKNKVVLNIGRLTDDKRHLLLIRLWSQTNGRNADWKLHIIGVGENEDKIRDLIKKLDLEQSVFLFPNTQQIEEKFKQSSIFVLTSKAEGFGLVLAEAMAYGVPCISFNVPSGPKDIIVNNQSGYLIDDNNSEDFVNKLNRLMSDYELRTKYGMQARIDISKFKSKIISSKLHELINKYFE